MIIEVKNISKSFARQPVLQDISFSVPQGERVIVLGQNGAGKTTLLRLLLGEYRPDAGEVRLCGVNPADDREKALQNVAFIPQMPPPLPVSIESLFDYAARTSGLDTEIARDYCHRFGLDVEAHSKKPFVKLSGGMKQKLLASLAFARRACVMFFDEPTANLDAAGRNVFRSIIQEDRFKDATMVFISHRVEELNTVLNRAIWLDLGRIVKDEKISA